MAKPSIPKGTRDFGPEQMFRRNYIIAKIREVFEKYGFQPLETPSMENLSVLTGKYGAEGDQLLYKVLNSGDYLSKTSTADYEAGSKALTQKIASKGLRYDLTVPFARYVVMHQNEITFPFRRYQIQPVWRADNPQKGRYREFYQCDADIIGTDAVFNDLEIVWLIHDVFRALNLEDYSLKFNNRKILTAISEYIGEPGKEGPLCVAIDKLDKIGQDGVIEELKKGGFNDQACQSLLEVIAISGSNEDKLGALDKKIGHLPKGREGLDEIDYVLKNIAHKKNTTFKLDFDISLARGLSYYTGAIFEVKPTAVKMGSITGGGRYDDLTGIFGLPEVSGIGISFGIDRIYDVMSEQECFPKNLSAGSAVLITNFGEETEPFAFEVLNGLRTAGISCEMYPSNAKMKKQFAYANKKGIPFVAVIGPDEADNQRISFKDMTSGEQNLLKLEEVIDKVIVK